MEIDWAGLLSFAAAVVLVSGSGVLMPGPVSAFVLAAGQRDAAAGAWVAVGHALIEIPVMAALFFGAGALFRYELVKIVVGLAGGLILLYLAVDLLRYPAEEALEANAGKRGESSPLWAGFFLSLLNPYFLLWWATAGAVLVSKSFAFRALGFPLLVLFHWSCDLGWFSFLSWLSHRGGRFFGGKAQRAVFAVCGMALVFFSGYFMGGAAFILFRP